MFDDAPFDAGLHVRLPAESFMSQAEFIGRDHGDDARLAREARIEAALATAEPTLSQAATCAACLRPAVLTSRTDTGRLVEGGLRVPDWPEQQTCDCEDRLCARERMLLHAAEASAGLRAWSRLLLVGPPSPVYRRLAALAGETIWVADLGRGASLAAADAAAQVIVAADCLHRAPALRALLRELRRVAAPGACLLATFPFRERAAITASRKQRVAGHGLTPYELHAIGWDILAALREEGWSEALMLRCWSRELGYLGPRNFLLRAIA